MRHVPIPAAFFTRHRQLLSERLPPGSLAVVNANDVLPRNADGSLPMVPSSDLFYLTGIEQEETVESEDLCTEELVGLGLLKKGETQRDENGKSPCKKYYMHGGGHAIGLDVHDVGHLTKPFAVGWCMTIEPGIYIPEERFAVRLEDVITITADGQTNLMADIPIEADDIERLMAGPH